MSKFYFPPTCRKSNVSLFITQIRYFTKKVRILGTNSTMKLFDLCIHSLPVVLDLFIYFFLNKICWVVPSFGNHS